MNLKDHLIIFTSFSMISMMKLTRNSICYMKLLIFILSISCIYGSNDKSSTHCVRWRATSNCDPFGVRDPNNDANCDKIIGHGYSGYCECENRRRVREVTCDHHSFTCEQACQEDASADLTYPTGFEYVTCGSSIKLVHETDRFRLHSHEVSYSTGSGQQSVTATSARNDYNSYWLIKEGELNNPCDIGVPIPCGSIIRLEHMTTRRNLHSHSHKAPLTKKNNEVSAYGVAGEGDTMDNWFLECLETQTCNANNPEDCEETEHPLWKRGRLVRLRHEGTQKYLVTSPSARFNERNCPRCPINGQSEVSTTGQKDEQTLWFAEEGIYVTE